MSKINLTQIDDTDINQRLLGLFIESFKNTTNGSLPKALVVTEDQAKKFFMSAGQINKDYGGIPIEVQAAVVDAPKQDDFAIQVVDRIIQVLHNAEVSAMPGVYRVLETAKLELTQGIKKTNG